MLSRIKSLSCVFETMRTSELFHDIATMSVDGAPGVVLVVHLAYFRTRDEFEGGEEICARLLFSVDGDGEPLRELCHHQQCLFQGELMHGHSWAPSHEDDELPRNCLFDPKFWSIRSDSVQDTNRQIFASRFAANDPLRTCDMKQTLDAFLHYAFLIYCSPPHGTPRTLDADKGPSPIAKRTTTTHGFLSKNIYI